MTVLLVKHEIQYVAMWNANLMVRRRPEILAHEIKEKPTVNECRHDVNYEAWFLLLWFQVRPTAPFEPRSKIEHRVNAEIVTRRTYQFTRKYCQSNMVPTATCGKKFIAVPKKEITIISNLCTFHLNFLTSIQFTSISKTTPRIPCGKQHQTLPVDKPAFIGDTLCKCPQGLLGWHFKKFPVSIFWANSRVRVGVSLFWD